MKLKRVVHLLFLLFLFIFVSCKKSSSPSEESFFQVKVEKVVDGDTVILENGEKLRYAGIDTPEIYGESGNLYPFALKAYKLNKDLTEGKIFYLELSLRKKDRYGRLLGELYFENKTAVSEILVKEGIAFVCYYPGSAKFYEKYLSLQKEAVKKRKGMYFLLDKQPEVVLYVGNKESKRFHHPDCPEAKKVKRKLYFKSIEEALLKGYCPARDCVELIFSF